MDDSTELLREMLAQQKEQTDLLRRNLTRIKFSLWTLMLLMTLASVVLGAGMYLTRSKVIPSPTRAQVAFAPSGVARSYAAVPSAPNRVVWGENVKRYQVSQ